MKRNPNPLVRRLGLLMMIAGVAQIVMGILLITRVLP